MNDESARLPQESKCPACGHVMDSARGLGERFAPVAGDVAVCAGCGEVLLFNEDLNMRQPDAMELLRIELNAELWSKVEPARRAVRAARRRRQKR